MHLKLKRAQRALQVAKGHQPSAGARSRRPYILVELYVDIGQVAWCYSVQLRQNQESDKVAGCDLREDICMN